MLFQTDIWYVIRRILLQANTWQDPSPDIIDDANDEIEDNTCPDITDDDGDDECEDYFASFADTDKI